MTQATNVVVQQLGTKDVTTRFGEKKTYSFKADGVWYSCGFKKPAINAGDTVSFDFKESAYGKDVDLPSIKKTAGANPVPAPTGVVTKPAPSFGGKGVFPIPALDGQRSIVRQNALTNARELVCNYFQVNAEKDLSKMDHIVSEVIRIARQFEAYACGDLDMEEVEAEMAERKVA